MSTSKLFFINGCYIFHIGSGLSMQTLPASDPFPIAGIAFVPHDELRGAFRFMMSYQRGEDRRDFRMIRFAFVVWLWHFENRSSTKRVSYCPPMKR